MAYNGRRAPNVSQYLRDLNSTTADISTSEDTVDFEADLAMFTNTQFFDFDAGHTTDLHAHPAKPMDATVSAAASDSSPDDMNAAASVVSDMNGMDFINDFSFGDFNTYASPTIATFPESLVSGLQPLQASPTAAFTPVVPQQPYAQSTSRIGDKHKADPLGNHSRELSFEEKSRIAAEEDKRRRNTAASARFRVKKKQREQALEKSAKEMADKVNRLETRIQQLETENKWLKNLLTEKNGGDKEEMDTLWRAYSQEMESQSDKATEQSPSES